MKPTSKFRSTVLIVGLGAAIAGSFAVSSFAAQKTAIFAGGCFWCIEKDFEHVNGVIDVVSGYTGGTLKNPTYKNHEGHVEAVKVIYDDAKVSYDQLLHTFWRTVDPTDAGGQFCDRGHAYTTAVFTADAAQLKVAKESLGKAEAQLGQKIVTPIRQAAPWTDAEGYHQNYYKKNPLRYKYYRFRCGRDQRVEALWGSAAYPGVSYKVNKGS